MQLLSISPPDRQPLLFSWLPVTFLTPNQYRQAGQGPLQQAPQTQLSWHPRPSRTTRLHLLPQRPASQSHLPFMAANRMQESCISQSSGYYATLPPVSCDQNPKNLHAGPLQDACKAPARCTPRCMQGPCKTTVLLPSPSSQSPWPVSVLGSRTKSQPSLPNSERAPCRSSSVLPSASHRLQFKQAPKFKIMVFGLFFTPKSSPSSTAPLDLGSKLPHPGLAPHLASSRTLSGVPARNAQTGPALGARYKRRRQLCTGPEPPGSYLPPHCIPAAPRGPSPVPILIVLHLGARHSQAGPCPSGSRRNQ